MQQSIFDLRIEDYEPTQPTAHLKKVGYDNAGNQYAVKRVEDGNWIPLTEWVGYSLCRILGIATPDFTIGHDENNQPVFCSKWENGKVFTRDEDQMDALAEIKPRLQAIANIIALDEFIENPDRHAGNLIFRDNTPNLLAFDFALSQFTKSACNAKIDQSKTDQTQALKTLIAWLSRSSRMRIDATEITNKIKKLQTSDLDKILTSAPFYWMQQAGLDCIIAYLSDKQKRL